MAEEQRDDHELVPIQPSILKDIDTQALQDADYEVLVQMGIDAGEVKIYSQWLLGKLANAILVHKHGDLVQYAKEVRQNYESLRQYGKVYEKFTQEDPNFHPDKYAGSIPWGVLHLAAMKSDKPQKLVDDLADKGVASIEGAYREIKSEETGQPVPRKPRVKLSWDTEKLKYKLEMSPEDYDLIDWGEVRQHLLEYLNNATS